MIAHNIVKIRKCDGVKKWNSWYKDMIGEEFEVGMPMKFNGFRIYQVASPFKYIHNLILQDDCEVIGTLKND